MLVRRAGVGRRAFGLPTHLVALALALLLPTLGLAAAVAWGALQGYRAEFEGRLQDTARALALALDAEIGAYLATVTTLAGVLSLHGPSPDLAGFETVARRAAATLDTAVGLVDVASRRQVVNTALPPGTPTDAGVSQNLLRVVETRRPMLTDLSVSAVTRRPAAGVAVPVERDGRVAYLVAARVEPGRLSALLAAQGLRPDEFATLVDGRDVVVARSRDHAGYVGRPVQGWFADATTGRDRGIVRGPALNGDPTVFGFQRLRAAPTWTVVLGAPAAAYRESWQGPLRRLALGGGAALLLGTGLALLLARRLTRPVAALARRAQAVSANGAAQGAAAAPALPPSGVREIEALRTAVEDAQQALDRRAAAEREAASALRESERRLRLVVAELNHRAKNALATVQSLAMQTARGPAGADPAEFTGAFTARLRTLARAHDLLTAFAWEGAALGAVMRAGLAPWLEGAEGGGAARVQLGCPAEMPLPLLAPGQAQALVMALHELVTNATKYGALSVPGGHVEVGCRAGPDGAAVVGWREHGGPAVAAAPRRQGFGTRLLGRALAHDLGPGARVSLDFTAEGLRATLAFVPRAAAA